jgi:predicted RNA-binding Zn-ribbon protein involved in translation (DUF1610 family)
MIKYSISLFDNIRQRHPRVVEMGLEDVAKGLTLPVHKSIDDKSNLPLWSPTIFDGVRSTKNAQTISFIVYDMDDGDTTFDVWRLFAQRDLNVMVHTSASHSPAHHKYRIIIPLAQSLPKVDWPKIWRAAFELWMEVVGIGIPDTKAIKDMARVYFRYGWPAQSKLEGDFDESHPCHPSQYHWSGYWLGGHCLQLQYQHIELPPPPKPVVFNRSEPMTIGDAMMMDPQMRESHGRSRGGVVVGDYIKHVPCPSCGRRSVYWIIDPNQGSKWAQCNRINKCGFWSKLEDV